MTTHTTGPWSLEDNYFDNWSRVRGGAGQSTIANVSQHLVAGDANARLIAAAPELLAACEELVRYCDSMNRETVNRVPFCAARTAIAKAKGE